MPQYYSNRKNMSFLFITIAFFSSIVWGGDEHISGTTLFRKKYDYKRSAEILNNFRNDHSKCSEFFKDFSLLDTKSISDIGSPNFNDCILSQIRDDSDFDNEFISLQKERLTQEMEKALNPLTLSQVLELYSARDLAHNLKYNLNSTIPKTNVHTYAPQTTTERKSLARIQDAIATIKKKGLCSKGLNHLRIIFRYRESEHEQYYLSAQGQITCNLGEKDPVLDTVFTILHEAKHEELLHRAVTKDNICTLLALNTAAQAGHDLRTDDLNADDTFSAQLYERAQQILRPAKRLIEKEADQLACLEYPYFCKQQIARFLQHGSRDCINYNAETGDCFDSDNIHTCDIGRAQYLVKLFHEYEKLKKID